MLTSMFYFILIYYCSNLFYYSTPILTNLVFCFLKLRFVKTCLQLASSAECDIKVRQDHFDQMSRMIQDSNIGKIF